MCDLCMVLIAEIAHRSTYEINEEKRREQTEFYNEVRVDNCINIPASPKQFPTIILTNILGILISKTIVWEISWFCLNKPANISLIERSEGPIKTPMIMNPKTSNPKIEY